jgi:hypothetical protein
MASRRRTIVPGLASNPPALHGANLIVPAVGLQVRNLVVKLEVLLLETAILFAIAGSSVYQYKALHSMVSSG